MRTKQLTHNDAVLDRIWPLMELAGNPQQALRAVHIAGTSGKTSTAYYMAALLGASGSKVGLTVSPHVDSITERIQINGHPLNDAMFCSELAQFLDIVDQLHEPPSYFEIMYAFALWEFARQDVAYAVIETGLGGMLDATNVVRRADKVCVITDIGLDHMHLLGNTLPEIAGQKIGIVHEHNHVLSYAQSNDVMVAYRSFVEQKSASLQIVSEPAEQPVDMPAFQFRNWNLAMETYRYIAARDHLPEPSPAVCAQTQATTIPGRLEARQLGVKTLVMDGAHNEQKVATFVRSFTQLYPNVCPTILVALKEGKEYEKVIPLLAGIGQRFIVTTFDTSQDLPARSIDPTLLAAALRAVGISDVTIEPDHAQAFARLQKDENSHLLIIGSFYLLSQIRNDCLRKEPHQD